MVGSIYNMGVLDKVAAAWVKAGVCRTLEGEAVARRRYQETGLSLEKGGCVGRGARRTPPPRSPRRPSLRQPPPPPPAPADVMADPVEAPTASTHSDGGCPGPRSADWF